MAGFDTMVLYTCSDALRVSSSTPKSTIPKEWYKAAWLCNGEIRSDFAELFCYCGLFTAYFNFHTNATNTINWAAEAVTSDSWLGQALEL